MDSSLWIKQELSHVDLLLWLYKHQSPSELASIPQCCWLMDLFLTEWSRRGRSKGQCQAANEGPWGWFGKGEPLLVIWKIRVSIKRNYPKKSIKISVQSWGEIQISSIKFKKNKKVPKGEIYQIVEQSPAKSSESRMVWVTSFKCFTWYHIYTVNKKHFHLKNCCYICVWSTLHLEKQKTIFTFSLLPHFLLLFSYYWEHSYCFLYVYLFCFVLFLCRWQTEELENAECS